jgi:hypothetical protein
MTSGKGILCRRTFTGSDFCRTLVSNLSSIAGKHPSFRIRKEHLNALDCIFVIFYPYYKTGLE